MKIICVVGARPNFMKAAPVIEALRGQPGIEVMLVHTGQHYDRQMSALFFDELGMPKPDLDLQVGSGSHGEQTGQIMIRFEPILKAEQPDLVIVFGDVNSTVAAALCAAKLGIRVAHVEAGLRSFDRTMPEELNRILTDHLSDYLFTTEAAARRNLLGEGISEEKIIFVGNVMVDTLLKHRSRAEQIQACRRLNLAPRDYALLTLHRPSNVDDETTFSEIIQALSEVIRHISVVFPCHPRTRQQVSLSKLTPQLTEGRHGSKGRLIIQDPLGYLEFLSLMIDARMVLTDSGGIQEETTVLGIPCLTIRENTERPVTIEQGTNVLVGNSKEKIIAAALNVLNVGVTRTRVPELWDGKAAERIAEWLSRTGVGGIKRDQ
ncbi:non-hydrolyzing UDP-N-acetylglucosamine 2-epimerase [Candidatus Nitrospira bockiana]